MAQCPWSTTVHAYSAATKVAQKLTESTEGRTLKVNPCVINRKHKDRFQSKEMQVRAQSRVN